MFRNSILYHRLWYLRKRNAARAGMLFRLICIAAAAALIGTYLNGVVLPAVVDISETSVRESVADAVDSALQSRLHTAESGSEYISVSRDFKGNIKSVEVNYPVLNGLSQDIIKSVQERLDLLQDMGIGIPAGVFLGNAAFSNMGPEFSVRLKPAGRIETEFTSHLVQAGINQTKHSINLVVKVTFGVAVPLAERRKEIIMDIPVAETVIVGNVPGNYINSK